MTHEEGRRTVGSVFRPSSFVLALIIVAYLSVGTLYAVKTPAWQVPDEPAHYNYVRFVAEGRGLPVLQSGDYDAAYLESIKAARFPPSMPIDSIRYEFWQPPLYYALAAPIYLATSGSLLALRLFSVALGGFVVVLAFLIVRRSAPGSLALALGSAAFVAFVPQHVAMMAGAQNDGVAELLLALIVLQMLNLELQTASLKWGRLGLTLGLALLTKGTIYMAVPLVAVAIWLKYRSQSPRDSRWLVQRGVLAFGPALVLVLPWWIRNAAAYGWPDLVVSIRHDAVVLGQTTPAEWIARFGLGGYWRDFAVTTFHSFWGQFGWMGVPMNGRYYAILAGVSLVAFIGFIWYSNVKSQISNFKGHSRIANLKFETWILIFWVVFAALDYVGYNVKYVQFQGRYLFPALIPIGLAFTIGLRQWTTLLPRAWRDLALAVPFVGLVALDVVALFRMIVPALTL